MRQAQKAPSFKDASADLLELASLPIGPTHLHRLSLRIGREWQVLQDAEVDAFRRRALQSPYHNTAKVATVMVDGGRVQARQENAGRGVSNPGWRETKVACIQSLATEVHARDPQPEPPAKFLDRAEVARLASESKCRGRGARPKPAEKAKPKGGRKKQSKESRKEKRVRTVVASMETSEEFGWRVATEVQRRGLDQAARKGYICDGQKYN